VLLNNSISLALLLCVATLTGELSMALRDAGLDFATPDEIVSRRGGGGDLSLSSSSSSVDSHSHTYDLPYIALNVFTGSVGFFLNFAQLWCVGATSATTYAIIGTLNKIPITFVGHAIFHTKITRQVSLMGKPLFFIYASSSIRPVHPFSLSSLSLSLPLSRV
jgi:hypothetical protein